ncbi:hypothetical protein CFP56_011232 [Quercus suber]|uniref:Uncharacterized protein n=1 Tax=Quercus suber TaxID=58331 RepID=A0AAW0MH97_QUESU|nr:hypothetical protein CFP56_40826 [Quercus suber]
MEAEEFGEMMEHVDEFNFALVALGNSSPYGSEGLACCPCSPFAPLYSRDSSCGLKVRRTFMDADGLRWVA